ncbi:MAG: Do family serine endopeptidase [bacterium]
MMNQTSRVTQSIFASMLVIMLAFGAFTVGAQNQVERPEEGQNFANQLSAAFRHAAETVLPAVVSISAEAEITPSQTQRNMPQLDELPDIFKHFFGPDMFRGGEGGMIPQIPRQRAWQGSGVIISPEGEILTNNHVVDDATELHITLYDGRKLEAEVVATDPATDIALIKLTEGEGFSYAKIGDSERLQVGDWVLAVGNPFGLSHSVSEGIVSALGRTGEDVPIGAGQDFFVKDYIQTTAAINPGNSGGPLINLQGEVIGVNNAIQTAGIAANLGIGFAIPSNLANTVIESLKKYGKVRRGYIGVQLVSLSGDIADYYEQEYNVTQGALVQQVLPGTPGEKAGLQKGDLIIEFNGKPISGSSQLVNLVTSTEVGKDVQLTVLRKGERKNITLTLTERPATEELTRAGVKPEIEQETLPEKLLGIGVESYGQDVAVEMGYDQSVKGVIVNNVQPSSAAAAENIQKGDIISEINDTPVQTVEEFEKVLSDIRKDMRDKNIKTRAILLYVHRANSEFHPRYVALTLRLSEAE